MKIFIQLKNVVVEHPYQQSKTQKYEKQHGQPTPGFLESLYIVSIFFQDCIPEEDVQLLLFHPICKLLESYLFPLKASGGL